MFEYLPTITLIVLLTLTGEKIGHTTGTVLLLIILTGLGEGGKLAIL